MTPRLEIALGSIAGAAVLTILSSLVPLGRAHADTPKCAWEVTARSLGADPGPGTSWEPFSAVTATNGGGTVVVYRRCKP